MNDKTYILFKEIDHETNQILNIRYIDDFYVATEGNNWDKCIKISLSSAHSNPLFQMHDFSNYLQVRAD